MPISIHGGRGTGRAEDADGQSAVGGPYRVAAAVAASGPAICRAAPPPSGRGSALAGAVQRGALVEPHAGALSNLCGAAGRGEDGPDGPNEADGLDGADGVDGVDGAAGADGVDGVDGAVVAVAGRQLFDGRCFV